MRDLEKYPVTLKEVVSNLNTIANEIEWDMGPEEIKNSMSLLLIRVAVVLLKKHLIAH